MTTRKEEYERFEAICEIEEEYGEIIEEDEEELIAEKIEEMKIRNGNI